MLNLTDNAIKRFKELAAEKSAAGWGIRLFDSGSGCCGPALAFDVVEAPETGDMTVEKDGLKIFLEVKANLLLAKATMDFSDKAGFIITGMSESSCGC